MSRAWLAGVVLAATFVTSSAAAVTAQRVTVRTQDEWLQGRASGVRIDADGTLMLSSGAVRSAVVEEPVVWSVAPGPDGSVWLGTGSNGRLLRYDETGALLGTITLPELQIMALVSDGKTLYAATSPAGAIYRVRPGSEPVEIARPGATYIWALALGRDGEVFAATGVEGTIYKIRKGGEVEVFHDASDVHITSLVARADGTLVAGTAERGLILEIDSNGRATVLYDSVFKEARALAVAKSGSIFAAINGGSSLNDPNNPQQGQATVTVTASGPPSSATPQAAIGLMPPEAFGDVSTEVVRIEPDGSVEVVAQMRGEIVHSLALGASSELLIGTSKRLVVPDELDRQAVVALGDDEAMAAQVSAIARSGKMSFVATTEPSRLFVLRDGGDAVGTYTSQVVAVASHATWGALITDAELDGCSLELETRSGSTLEPGESWSQWVPTDGVQVRSEPSRFLQWRLRLAAVVKGHRSAKVHSVMLSYLARNRRPIVKTVKVHPPGAVFQKASGPPYVFESNPPPIPGLFEELRAAALDMSPQGPPMYRRGAQTLSWEVEDPDDDEVFVRLAIRRRDGGPWLPMIERPDGDSYAFDSEVLPDGWYVARIEASDADGNPARTALTASRETTSFRVDNTPPNVEHQKTTVMRRRAEARFVATDAGSGIWKAEWSLDGGPFAPVAALDGVSDGAEEIYQLEVDDLEPGEHLIVLRVHDMAGTTSAVAAPLSIR